MQNHCTHTSAPRHVRVPRSRNFSDKTVRICAPVHVYAGGGGGGGGREEYAVTPAVSCTGDGADWPKVVAVGAQQPISDFFGFIQIRDTLSTNGEHHRVAEVKSFPAKPKSMRSVNGEQNGANLKKWSVLLVCTMVV